MTVNTSDDHDDGDCTAGDCTLREAVAAANAGPGVNTILFDPSVTGTIVLALGQLEISDDLVITGPGSAALTVSGDNVSRVFDITSGQVEIAGLTIADGNDDGYSGGGGILIHGGVVVTGDDLVVFNNRSPAGNGGGIANRGNLTLTNLSLIHISEPTRPY